MAISVLQGPGFLNPAYNNVFWVVSSTNTAQPNFEYICDLSITGVTFAGGASYLRLKTPADPTYGRGVFNVAPILSRYLTGDIGDTIYGFQQCSNSVKNYSLQFGELYGPSSGVVAYPNLAANGQTVNVFNGSFDIIEERNYLNANYVANAYTSNANVNILTNAPSSGTIRSSQNQWIYVMSQTSGAVKFANINTYTGVGASKTLANTYRVINHSYHDAAGTAANRMLRFPCGGANLNNIVSSSISPSTNDGITNLISGTVTAWEIYFTDSARNRITESYWNILDNPCTQHDVYRLHFKNKWGAYDSFNFIRANQVVTDVKRSNYEKVIGEFKSASSYINAKSDRFETNFYTEYKPTIRINSDWITEDQSTWLEELITSNDIRVEDSSGNLIPINILDTNYTRRQHKTDKIFNLSVQFQYSYTNTRQGA